MPGPIESCANSRPAVSIGGGEKNLANFSPLVTDGDRNLMMPRENSAARHIITGADVTCLLDELCLSDVSCGKNYSFDSFLFKKFHAMPVNLYEFSYEQWETLSIIYSTIGVKDSLTRFFYDLSYLLPIQKHPRITAIHLFILPQAHRRRRRRQRRVIFEAAAAAPRDCETRLPRNFLFVEATTDNG